MAKGRKTGGRVKGTPNKATAAVKEALTKAFDELGGIPALVDWGRLNQTEFYKLWIKLLPQEVTGDDGGPIQVTVTKQQRDAAVAAALDADS